VSDLAFDEDAHAYTLDGVAIPSVTQILGWGSDTSRIPKYTGLRGRLVHKACELDNLSTLDESTLVAQEIDGRWVDPWPYLRAWREYARGERPYAVEHAVWGEIDGMRYAGTIDVVWPTMLDDIKTGKKPRPDEHGPQVQAYRHALEQSTHYEVMSAGCVYLREDGTHERVPYDEARHFNAFRTALARWYRDNA